MAIDPNRSVQGSNFRIAAGDIRTSTYALRAYVAAMATTGYALNFADWAPQAEEIVLTGNLVLTTTGLPAGRLKHKTLILTASGGSRNLTVPAGWVCLGTAPTSIASGKIAKLEITSRGATDATVIFTYAVQP